MSIFILSITIEKKKVCLNKTFQTEHFLVQKKTKEGFQSLYCIFKWFAYPNHTF